MPHFLLRSSSAAAGYSPITHDWGLHPISACSRKQQCSIVSSDIRKKLHWLPSIDSEQSCIIEKFLEVVWKLLMSGRAGPRLGHATARNGPVYKLKSGPRAGPGRAGPGREVYGPGRVGPTKSGPCRPLL